MRNSNPSRAAGDAVVEAVAGIPPRERRRLEPLRPGRSGRRPLSAGPTGAATLAAVLLLSGCADTQTRVLPAYALANGRVHQDVVTVAADGSGGAPVITSLTTYDVSSRRQSVVIARESASAPGVGLAMASGLGGAVIS